MMSIVKARGSPHSKKLVSYDITDKGIVIGPPISGYEGVLTGVAKRVFELTKQLKQEKQKSAIALIKERELSKRALRKERVIAKRTLTEKVH